MPVDEYIEQQEIKKAVNGKPFELISESGTEKCQAISFSDFWYYYQLWEDFHYFGLYNGVPAKEGAWYLDWIKTCQRWHEQCKNYAERQRMPHIDK